MRRSLKYVLLIACLALSGHTRLFSQVESKVKINYQLIQVKTGFNLGWESPYSAGIEFSFLFNELIDANVGCGFGLSGAKLGIGSRIFPNRISRFSPMFGVFFYHAYGMHSLDVSVNQSTGTYYITPDNALLLNTGLRYRFSKGHYLIGSIGYSHPAKGYKAVYRDGAWSNDGRAIANMLATGGLSVNIGILLKLNKGHYN